MRADRSFTRICDQRDRQPSDGRLVRGASPSQTARDGGRNAYEASDNACEASLNAERRFSLRFGN